MSYKLSDYQVLTKVIELARLVGWNQSMRVPPIDYLRKWLEERTL